MAIPDVQISAVRLFTVCFLIYSTDDTNVYGFKGGKA